MSESTKVTRIKKGFDIHVAGSAQPVTEQPTAIKMVAVKPTDYVGLTPRLLVKEGDNVKAGSPLFYDKNNEALKFPSPISGTVHAIVRGEKRALLRVEIEPDGLNESLPFAVKDPQALSAEEVRAILLRSGAWTLLRQRPFGIVPPPETTPKALFISAFDSAPLAADYDYMMKDSMADFQTGIYALGRLVSQIHISLSPSRQSDPTLFNSIKGAHLHYFEGPHPTGLVGTQIAHIDPINKGEQVWTLGVQEVAIIGRLFGSGVYRPDRTVAIAGPVVEKPHYVKVVEGAYIRDRVKTTEDNVRYISGNILSGTTITDDGFLCTGANIVSVIPEGNQYDFMGWLMPGLKKYSFSRTFLSGFMKCSCGKNKRYLERCTINTGMHGSVRPLVVTGDFEKVVPMDIYPLQLLKACIIGDIDLMEQLGVYEVEPEDFALCEFIDTSKTEIQTAIRQGLELVRTN